MRLTKLGVINAALVAVTATGGGLAYAAVGTPKAASSTGPTRTATVGVGTVMSTISSSGNVVAPGDITVNFATSGKLTELDVTVGQRVKEGDVLARIDSTAAAASLDAAKAQLASAQAKLTTVLDGPTSLVKQGLQISESQAQQQVKSAQASLDNANQSLTLNQTQQAASVAQAKQQLANDQAKYLSDEATLADAIDAARVQAAQQLALDQKQLTADIAQAAADHAAIPADDTDPTYQAAVAKYDRDEVSVQSDTNKVATDGTAANNYTDAAVVIAAVKNQVTTLGQDQSAIDKDQTAVTNAVNTQTAALARDNQSIKTAQQQLTNAQLSLEALQNSNAQKTASPATSDVQSAQAAVEQAQAQVDTAQQTLDATALTAPADGTISAINASVGQTVSASGAGSNSGSNSSGNNSSSSNSSPGFISLTNLTNLQVVADIDEADSAKVKVDAPAVVTLNALPGKQFAAHVIELANSAAVSSNVVQYQVTFALDSTDSTIKPGMTANVSVTTSKVDGVLNVTSTAIHGSGASSYVMVVQPDGTQKQVDVVVGLKGDTTTEISGALKEGDDVVLPAATVNRGSTTTTNQRQGGGGFFGGGGGGGGRFFPGGG
jgi:multidrug efflux pump subunit AcrA (membrane-fusion protein)